MSRISRSNKADANQSEIVQGIRDAGYSVCVTSMVGDGFTDIVCGGLGRNILIEIKNPDMPPNKRKLTPEQVRFHKEWQGPIGVAETLEEALLMIECANYGGTG